MFMKPKISIVIPTYNRASYLPQTIQSALDQEYPSYEVILCDNASTDNTAEVIAPFLDDPRVRYYRQEHNVGMVGNWHTALHKLVSGEWFVILSDDDYFIDPTYLTKAAQYIQETPSLSLVYGTGYIKNEADGSLSKLDLPFEGVCRGKTLFLSRGCVHPQDFLLCNVLFRTAYALTLNPFENSGNLCCDSELFLKMCQRGDVGVISEPSAVYRIHGTNLIKTVNTNFDLFFGSLDYIFEPYIMAQREHFLTEQEEEAFENRFVIPAMRSALLTAKLYFPSRYSDVVRQWGQRYPSLLGKSYSGALRIKLFLASMPTLYKKISALLTRLRRHKELS